MDAAFVLVDSSKFLDLEHIRYQLIRMEDTITFHMIERVQFPLNPTIYVPAGVKIPNSDLSLMDYILREQERICSRVRRYQALDEYPFFPDVVEEPILAPLQYPKLLHPNTVNVNNEIKNSYIHKILPHVCKKSGRQDREDGEEEKENYGSTAVADVACLQSLSRRIHYGKFVAEAKFRQDPEKFVKLIKAGDIDGINKAITNSKVEAQVLERLRSKAKAYGTDPSIGSEVGEKINVDAVVAMYQDSVIPLTKEVEVDYLMQRLKGTQWE